MDCPNCHRPLRSGTRYCEACGAMLLTTCPSCGAEVSPDGAFCGHCGANLRGPTSAAASAPPRRSAAPRKSSRRGDWVLAMVFLAGLALLFYGEIDNAGGVEQALRRNLDPAVRAVTAWWIDNRERQLAGRLPMPAPTPERPTAVGSDRDAYARSAILALIVSPRFTGPAERIEALTRLKAEMGAEAFEHALAETPTDVLLAALQRAGATTAARLGAPVAERGLPGPARPSAAAEDPLALWILSQKAIALARADDDAAGDDAMQGFQDDLGEQLFQVVVRNVPVTDPHTGQVFTLEEYANRTYRQASEALESQVTGSVNVEAVRAVVGYLDRNQVPWKDALVAGVAGQDPGEVLGPWVMDRTLSYATERATEDLGLTDRDVSLLVAATKVAVGVHTGDALLTTDAGIELAALAREDLNAADSRLRPVADWALDIPQVRQAYDQIGLGQTLSEVDFEMLRKGVGDAQLWLEGSPDAWMETARMALQESEVLEPAQLENWTALATGDAGAALALIGTLDLQDASVDDYFADLMSGMAANGFEPPQWDLEAVGLPELEQIDLSSLDSLEIPGLDKFELPSLGELQLPGSGELQVPEFEAPEIEAPQFEVPEIEVPELELPDLGDLNLPGW